MELASIIDSCAAIAATIGSEDISGQIEHLRESARRKEIKVVVIGDFKAGKSSLINRVFLRRNVLPIGYLETTAVPVQLRCGSMRMQLWSRDQSDGSETCVEEKEFFTEEDINRAVTAGTAELRAQLATKYSKVTISMPDILPSGITLVDTPGLNTPNRDIYMGTMREARTAHAVLYVVRDKQLSEREITLLANLAGMQQPSLPMHVVLSLEEGQYEQGKVDILCREITAQLAGVGVNQCGISVFYPNGKDEQTALQKDLQDFLAGDVQRGLEARTMRDLRPLLIQIETALRARLELSGKSEQEIAGIREASRKKQEEYRCSVRQLLAQVAEAQSDGLSNLDKKLVEFKTAFETDLGEKESVGDVLDAVKVWQEGLPQTLQRLLSLVIEDLKMDMAKIGKDFSLSLTNNLEIPTVEGPLDSSWFLRFIAEIPQWIFYTLDIALTTIILPTGFLTDLVIRIIGEFLPIIKNLLPVNIAGTIARKIAVGKFNEQMDILRTTVAQNMKKNFDEMFRTLSTGLENIPVFKELDDAIALAEKGLLSTVEKGKIDKDIVRVSSWMSELYGQQPRVV